MTMKIKLKWNIFDGCNGVEETAYFITDNEGLKAIRKGLTKKEDIGKLLSKYAVKLLPHKTERMSQHPVSDIYEREIELQKNEALIKDYYNSTTGNFPVWEVSVMYENGKKRKKPELLACREDNFGVPIEYDYREKKWKEDEEW